MSQSIDLLRDTTLQKTNALLAVIAKNSGKGENGDLDAAAIRTLIRGGVASDYFRVGDQITCYRATAGSVTTDISGGSATIDYLKFVARARTAAPGPYEFRYDGALWEYNGKFYTAAQLTSEFGITVTGTAAEGDHLVVSLTANLITWDVVDFDQKVYKAWTYNGVVYYTCIDKPATGELVLTLSGETFRCTGTVTTAYNAGSDSIGITTFAGVTVTAERAKDLDTADGTHNHSLELLMHDGYPVSNVQFDAAEAILENTNETALAAGTYTFKVNGVDYSFITTQEIPAGGQAVPTWDSEHTTITALKTYASAASTEVIETITPTKNSTDGTSLSAVNVYSRSYYGDACFRDSAIRQWANTNGDANAWWAKQHRFDRPSSHANLTGFLRGLDPDFAELVSPVNSLQRLYSVKAENDPDNYADADDNGVTAAADWVGCAVTKDKFTLASYTEMYFGKLSSTFKGASKTFSENTAFKYFSRLAASATTSALAGRKKYRNGSACYWWGRSASHASGAYGCNASGADGSYSAHSTGSAAVLACSII